MEPSIDDVSGVVVDTALRVHRGLGPGLLESVYETVLAAKLVSMGYKVDRQVPVDIEFEEMRFKAAFRADLIVANCLLVEVKSVEQLNGVHAKQLLTYLRLTARPVGLLLNFGGETLKGNMRRIVNDYIPSVPSRLRVNQKLGEFDV